MLLKKIATVDKSQCVSCGTCIKECFKNAITVWQGCYAVVDEQNCVGCGKCSKVCPVGCINILPREEK